MKRFRERHLREFAVGDNALEKSFRNILKILKKRTGYTFYGNPQILQTIKSSDGYKLKGAIFYYGPDKQIRFNVSLQGSSRQIHSIDFWFSPKLQPDLTLDIPNVNIVQLLDIVATTIKTERPVQDLVLVNESTHVFEREKATQWFSQIEAWIVAEEIENSYLETTDPKKIRKEISAWLEAQGERIEGRSLFANLKNWMLVNGIENPAFLNVKVKPGKKYKRLDSEGMMAAQNRFQVITDPDLEPLTPAEIFDQIELYVKMIVKGDRNALLIVGTPGIGKTTEVEEALGTSDWVAEKGVISTALKLYTKLYENNGQIVLFDDCDSVLVTAESGDILKHAADDKEDRVITFPNQKPEVPDSFAFVGRTIFISNLTIDQVNSALVSRALKVEVELTFDQVMERIKSLIEEIPEIKSVDLDTKMEVFDFILSKKQYFSAIDIRTFGECVRARTSGAPYWKKIVANTLRIYSKTRNT